MSGSILFVVDRWLQSLVDFIIDHFTLSFLPQPLIALALLAQFLAHLFNRSFFRPEPVGVYLPRLPAEIFVHVASFLPNHEDLVRFSYASSACYHAANRYLYKSIVLKEHPAHNIPWFRRRLYRLSKRLTSQNAAEIRHIDVESYTEINDKLLLSILRKCAKLNSLRLRAMLEPIRMNHSIKQPVFLSERLCVPIYTSVTCLVWTGPFIPFRGPRQFAGQAALRLFPNLRSLKMVFDGATGRCENTYPPTQLSAVPLFDDLQALADSCPLLEDITFPFWESAFAEVLSWERFRRLSNLRTVQFSAVDSPGKDVDHGRGLVLFANEMGNLGMQVTFFNPHRTHLDITSVFEELQTLGSRDSILPVPFSGDLAVGPVGPPANPWRRQLDILEKLSWYLLQAENDNESRQRLFTLRWPVTVVQRPAFEIPTMFNGVEFLFNTPARARRDPSQFLEFKRLVELAVEMPHIERLRIQMECVDAFYLSFPLFWVFEGKKTLTLRIDRMVVGEGGGVILKRQWRLKQGSGGEEDVSLEELGKHGIHVHPSRLVEKIMLQLMFQGQRKVDHITAVFRDEYLRRRQA
jgi:hypothetical protein